MLSKMTPTYGGRHFFALPHPKGHIAPSCRIQFQEKA